MGEKQKSNWIPQKGSWIIITKQIPTEIPVPLFSIWYAIPSNKEYLRGELEMGGSYSLGYDLYKTRYGSVKELKEQLKMYNVAKTSMEDEARLDAEDALDKGFYLERQLKIKTPFGDVCIQPHEYNVMEKERLSEYVAMIDEGHVQIKHLSDNPSFKGKIKEQIFYLRSRGIPFNKALELVSGNIQTQNAFYLLMHPEYRRIYDPHFESSQELINRFCRKVERELQIENVKKQFFFNEEEALKLQLKSA